MREVYTRREAIVAALLGLAVAAIVWGPVLLRPADYTPAGELQSLALPRALHPPQMRLSMRPAKVTKIKPGKPVDINVADAPTLQLLPGIGPTLARRIVSHREANGPFGEAERLMEVEGIGARRFEKLRPWIEAR